MTKTLERVRFALGLLLLVGLPTAAFAQAAGSITGIVKDTSGAVLPGVTVEAASPALIEKVRSVVSAGDGQYRIVNLGPGTYSITFTLPGFSTFKRDGVEMTGDFTATINAEMKVGAQEETITVTGEAPTVDVQGVQRQRVLTNEVVEAVPTGKYFVNLGVLIPGVSASCSAACQGGSSQDTGGSAGDSSATLVAHGSRFRDQRISINNMTVRGATGYLGVTGPNIEAMQETQIDTSGADASIGTGGVRINVVPKDGGNKFAGGFYFTGTNQHFQSKNVDQNLLNRGLAGNTSVKSLYDVAPTLGGPIMQDKLWFFLSYRRENNLNYAANLFENSAKNNPALFTYAPDLTKQTVLGNPLPMAGVRLTFQATARNKFSASFDYRDRCQCPNLGSAGTSPDAAMTFQFRPQHVAMATWSSPVTNRLLLQASVAIMVEGWGARACGSPGGDCGAVTAADPSLNLLRISGAQNIPTSFLGVTTFRAAGGGNWTWYPYRDTGFSATYVTGAHAIKAGIDLDWGKSDAWATPNQTGPISSIRVNYASTLVATAAGVNTCAPGLLCQPNQFTVNSGPTRVPNITPADAGAYVQDRWTYKRMTLSGGLRLDYYNRYTAAVTFGPTPLQPTRNVTFPQEQVTKLTDLSPRLGVAWDVFGTGKTAFKMSINRYVVDQSPFSNSGGSQASNYVSSASRTWTDSNHNFYPDCDLANPNAQNLTATGGDSCAAFTGANANFGLSVPTSVNDRDTQFGFNHRGYNWEFSSEIQQEIIPRRVAVDLAFFRRWYGNFTMTDNYAIAASDYGAFSVVVPAVNPTTGQADLPLAGQTITGFLDANPNVSSLPSDNHVRVSSIYGKQYETWQGIDLSTTVRLPRGAQVQAGLSTGKNVTDNCAAIAIVPEAGTPGISLVGSPTSIAGPLANPFCHQESAWLTQVKGLATYTVPRIDVQLSGAFQMVPGLQRSATLVVPCGAGTDAAAQLGRACTASGGNVTVNILAPGSSYGPKLYQTDVRVGKIIRFAGNRRATASIDLFNLFNGNTVLQATSVYPTAAGQANFEIPTRIQQGRLLKFTFSANF